MTLLIKNVHILGGVRTFPESMDVFVNGDKISAIGDFGAKRADVVLDGQGAYLAPGFIDVNTGSDHYLTLFDHPSQDDFLSQGVTTMIGGMCGSSLAPLLYGSLESLQKWGDPDRVNVNWHSMEEFLKVMDRRPLGVNFGTLAGHSTLRRAIVGEALRDLTKNELAVFSRALTAALGEGAFGFSTGLDYVHARKAPYSEIKHFADIAKTFRGVYATHLRQTNTKIKESVEETIKLAREANVRTLISHFVPVVGSEKEYEAALDLIEALPPEVDFHFDIYPSSSSLLPVYVFLPLWVQNGGIDVMLANINDQWLLPRIIKDMPQFDEEHFIIAQAPGSEFLVGKSLRDIKLMFGVADGREAVIRLMAAVKMKCAILYKNLNPKLAERAMKSKRSFIASNAPSFSSEAHERRLKSERTTSTFTKFLSMVKDQQLLPLNEANTKLTAAPAKKFGHVGRGEIKEGNFADLACFKGSEIKFTVVNGVVAYKDGAFQQTFPGKILRHSILV